MNACEDLDEKLAEMRREMDMLHAELLDIVREIRSRAGLDAEAARERMNR